MSARPNWVEILGAGQPWQKAYPVVAKHAREILSDGRVRSTMELMLDLWPTGVSTIGNPKIWRRLEQALRALAVRDLADCTRRDCERKVRTRGARGTWYTKSVRPWRWGLWGSPNDEVKPNTIILNRTERELLDALQAMVHEFDGYDVDTDAASPQAVKALRDARALVARLTAKPGEEIPYVCTHDELTIEGQCCECGEQIEGKD